MSSQSNCVIKNTDMTQDMQKEVIDFTRRSIDIHKNAKDVASYIKNYSGTWHCVVGRNFGSYVTHELKHYIYFYIGQCAILLFKTS